MSQEIAVVGSPDFTTGFRLAGVRTFETVAEDEKDEQLDEAVAGVFDDDNVGIVVMHTDDLEYLSRDVRETAETSVGSMLVSAAAGAPVASAIRSNAPSAST